MISKYSVRNKYRMVPNHETVTYQPMNPKQTPVSIAGARFKATGEANEATGQATVTTDFSELILPDAQMGGYQPRIGDRVTATSTRWAGEWIVKSARSSVMGNMWHCGVQLARNEA